MKSKYKLLLGSLVVSMFCLTGCSTITLTEQESDMIAQYSAGVLLNSSENYEDRLTTYAVSQAAIATEAPVTTAAPAINTVEPTDTPNSDEEPTQTQAPQSTLAELYHLDGIDISYQNYQFCNEYSENSNSYQIMANDDEVLLVLKFKVKNGSGSDKKISLLNREISYPLTADESEYKPTISVLENGGLNFLEMRLKAGKSDDAVLIYAVPKKVRDASSMILKIQEAGKESTVTVK